jgi:hypothetical protein
LDEELQEREREHAYVGAVVDLVFNALLVW